MIYSARRKSTHGHSKTGIKEEAIFCSGNGIPCTTLIVNRPRLLRLERTRPPAMHVIHWPHLQPAPADLRALSERLQEALPLRSLCRLLVEQTLRAYPWMGRTDLIPCYHPSHTYNPGQTIALFIRDPQKTRRAVWLPGQVRDAHFEANPVQGRFQVLTLDIHGRQIQMAGGIADAFYPEPDLSSYTSQDLAGLAEWVLETYAAPLAAIVRQLIQTGQICGRLSGDTFLPKQVSGLSLELLQPVFAGLPASRPWISLEEIFRALPDLASLERETLLGLLRATLKDSPYRSLGGDRWTTPELFDRLNPDLLRGVHALQISSRVPVWTKRDRQDLARYSSKLMPAEARAALEELGIGQGPPQPGMSPWRPPTEPVRLPALSYLHIIQGYFPVHAVMSAFAPEVQLVFVQFIHGEHQPFLLDRENGLLKAVQPQKLHARIQEEDLAAGTHLWLEYQGNERYRIAPRLLPFKRRVPCKLARLENGQLHIEHGHISMKYEGQSSLFKADLRFEEIETLFTEASRVNLSVVEAMIHALQEICATDPDRRAHRLDLFNAVLLRRACPPGAIAFLLYTEPCFESLGGGYFRYKPMQDITQKPRKQTARLSQLWDELLTDPVSPQPAGKGRKIAGAGLESIYSDARSYVPELAPVPLWSQRNREPQISGSTSTYIVVQEDRPAAAVLAQEQIEPIPVSDYEPELLEPRTEVAEPETHTWRDSVEKLLHSLVEPENGDSSPVLTEEANSEATSDLSIEAAHEESLSFSSPFRWDPRPAWVNPPPSSSPPLVDPRRFVYRPKLPARPFHRQRFYQRFFFYLRNWLGRRKAV